MRTDSGAYKLNFDLHRAFSLWTWGLLFIVAFTAFSLNLYREVFYPIMSRVLKVTPGPFETRQQTDKQARSCPQEVIRRNHDQEAVGGNGARLA